MNVLKKRFAPYLLVCVLVLSMIAPAFASSQKYEDYTNVSAGNTSTVINGGYVEAEIDVVVPTTGQAFINPYALPVKLGDITSTSGELGASESSTSSIQNQQIVTQPMFIQNKSEVELAVSASITGKVLTAAENQALGLNDVSSGVIFGTAAPTASTKTKTVFTYLQMKVAPNLTGNSTAGELIPTFTQWTDDSYNKDKDLVVGKTTATKENMVVLAGGTEASDGGLEATKGGIAMFRLAGKVVTDPTGKWQDTDTFKVTIAFTFEPDPARATLTTYDDKTLTSTGGSIKLNVGVSGSTGLKVSSVNWTATTPGDIGSVVTVAYDANAFAYVLKPVSTLTSGTNKVVKVIANVTASNGKQYTSDPLEITIAIP